MKKSIILLLLIFIGCDKESKFTEVGDKVYYEDKEGKIFYLNDDMMIEIKEFNEELITSPKFQKTKFWDGYKFIVLLKYIDNKCFYRISLEFTDPHFKDNKLYKSILDSTDEIFNFIFTDSDYFELKSKSLYGRKKVNKVRKKDGFNEIYGFEWDGTTKMTKDVFQNIENFTVKY